jgi:uncharacterized coiled-coil protein SlyX
MTEEVKEVTTEETPETQEQKEKYYSEREWKGLLSDKQREAQARQELQARLAAKETQYEDRIAQLEAKLAEKESNIGDPDDVATVATLKKEISRVEKKLLDMYTKEKQAETKAQMEKRINESFIDAQTKYTEDKTGKGLSFEEVNEGTTRMIARNPKYRELILNDPDPGEMAYKVGLQDPVIAKRYESYKQNMPSGKVTSKEGLEGSAAANTGYYSQEFVKKMSKTPGWITANLDKIRESQKQWEQA